MDQATLEKLIRSKKINTPLLVFAGPEVFLKEKTFALMVQSLVPAEDRSENVMRVTSNARELPETLNLIFSFSFNPSPRLFFIQEIDAVPAKQRKEFLDRLHNGGIPTETLIVFSVSDNRIGSEIITKFKQQSEKIDFWAPFANQLGAWVKREAAELRADISAEAADLLIELAGSDLALLHQELTKLAQGATAGKISLNDVKSGVAYLRQDTVFDFLEFFGRRSPVKAMRCLDSLISRGEAPQKLWFMLCRQLREFRLFHEVLIDRPDLFEPVSALLRKYRQFADKSDFKANQEKKNIIAEIQALAEQIPETLVRATGLKSQPKLRNLYLALNFSYSELIKTWPQMLATDLHLKSGAPDLRTALQNFVAGILIEKAA
ncbi:MAG: DNA polymerase III subunit delta [Candidatus Riflebacteria bacterium]|nr:DNA polymerase III subunit delta [Candidatus Riflebacteria bacterium]